MVVWVSIYDDTIPIPAFPLKGKEKNSAIRLR